MKNTNRNMVRVAKATTKGGRNNTSLGSGSVLSEM